MQKLKRVPLLDRVLRLVERTADDLGISPKRLILIALAAVAVAIILATV